MARLNVPWWMGVAVASFLSYSALIVYCEIRRPEHPGITTQFRDDRMHLTAVTPGSPADRAGLRAADQILAWGGWPIRSRLDLMAADANVVFGVVREVEVERGGARLLVSLPVTRAPWRFWRSQPGNALLVVRAGQLVTLAFAVFVLFRRPHDPLARTAVWLLASWAVFSLALPYSIAAVWRDLPWPVGLVFWFPHISSLALPAILFTCFVAMFPKSILHSAHALTLVWIPMLIPLAWAGMVHYRMVYPSNPLTSLPDWSQAPLVINAVYVVGGLVVLVVNYRHLEDTNARRRVRVLTLGALLGFGAGLPVYIRYWMVPGSPQADSFLMSPTGAVGTVLSLAFPLCFAYGVLRHRLFDVRVIIRQGIQYALARRLLLWAAPALLGGLLLDLLLSADDGIVPTLASRGWIYAGLGGLAWVAHGRRTDWLDRLDRRFFRERYSANQILRQVARRVRDADGIDQVASPVVTRIEEALHPEFVALLVRGPSQEASYRLLAIRPAARPLHPLHADMKVIGLLRLLGKPLQLSLTDSSWVMRQLPVTETGVLQEDRVELLVPIATDPQRMEALLMLGAKRSEEPYGADDLDLLNTIADNLALLLAQAEPAAPARSDTFEECPRCGACYDTGTGRCVADDERLTTSETPRVLGHRYRLTCRLGQGGMATVYEALDTSLQRTVAAKVIREDLLTSQNAVQRFRNEAQMAAGFTHPNVVTIHDFGSSDDAGNRAFLIMERLHGATLRATIQQGPMPPQRVVAVLDGVCAALGAAHRQQFVHRDLKPENIFLVKHDHGEIAKILDFGIAKALPGGAAGQATATTGVGVVLGTPSYMAPEQLRGEEVQLTWDLWAMAIVTYEMLTGRHPFLDRPSGGGFVGHPTAIEAGLSGEPDSWRPFFARALHLDPTRRPESPATFLAELHEALSR